MVESYYDSLKIEATACKFRHEQPEKDFDEAVDNLVDYHADNPGEEEDTDASPTQVTAAK
jgi:hypothetical protein